MLVIVGAGGHAKVVIGLAKALDIQIAGILDDNEESWGLQVMGIPILGGMEMLENADAAVLGIGSNQARLRISQKYSPPWMTLVHPAAWVDPSVGLGEGTVVMAGAIVQPNATIGRHVILNTASSVDHDCFVDDFAHMAPGSHLGGTVTVGLGAMVGIGASVHQGSHIGNWSTLGGGCFHKGTLPDGVLAVGVPSRITRSLDVPKV